MPDPELVIRETNLKLFDGLGHTQRAKYIDAGLYPPPFRLFAGGRAKAWWGSDIRAFQDWQRATQDGKAAKDSTWRNYLKPGNDPATSRMLAEALTAKTERLSAGKSAKRAAR
jgi:hypothetical protein